MNDKGYDLDQQIWSALKPVLVEALKPVLVEAFKKYDPNDIQSLATGIISTMCSEMILRKAMEMRKKEKLLGKD
jgi:hypothetical protein